MKKKKWIVLGLIVLLGAMGFYFYSANKSGEKQNFVYKEIRPTYQNIKKWISTTGIVQPQNRVNIMPPISGRVDKILVKEGDKVKAGETLVWLSSTERAALLDAAKTQGKEKQQYWANVYKATPLVAPISGKVIVRQVEPGQTVNSATIILVLSDRLVVKAQVDETDIGKVKLGQKTKISLDAYPEIEVAGKVEHISYESRVVSNVTVYEVDIIPVMVPEVFRSGMNANVDIITESKKKALVVPLSAVEREGDKAFVQVKKGTEKQRKEVELGIINDDKIEVLAGLSIDDILLIKEEEYSLNKKNKTRSFLSPQRKSSKK
jgi:membrane fusion protein, macrolide-specific efflux system